MSGLYDPGMQNQIAQQQIQFLIGQVENYHANDEEIMKSLKQANELNQTGNVQTAASIVYVKKRSFVLFYLYNNKGYYKSPIQKNGG